MSTSIQPAAQGRTNEPTILWNEVVKARSVIDAQRHSPIRRSAIARAQLLFALEGYAASLTNHGRPIPDALRAVLCLRRLASSD